MPSPFPGMNPYLEQSDTWEDFHHNFMTRAQEMLSGQVGPNYLVKIEVRLLLHELSAEERRLQLQLPAVEIERQAFVEIRDRRNRRVVTVVELLSPSNKTRGSDRDDYMAKRRQVLAGMTHLVEIDLRRGGTRPAPPELPPCDYYVLVSRYEQRPKLDLWPLALQERLPTVGIPLIGPDPDVVLDLQAVLHQTYDAADYGKYIYGETPEPALSGEQEAWARQFVPATWGGK